MRWKTYKKLTEEQRTEYDFRFKPQFTYPVGMYFVMTILFLKSLAIGSIFTIYFMLQQDDWVEQIPVIKNIADVTVRLLGFASIAIMVTGAEIFVMICWRWFKEWRWIKQNVPKD